MQKIISNLYKNSSICKLLWALLSKILALSLDFDGNSMAFLNVAPFWILIPMCIPRLWFTQYKECT